MEWLMILLVWLVAPFVQIGIIVALAVSNSRYKKQIQELTMRQAWEREARQMSLPQTGQNMYRESFGESRECPQKDSGEMYQEPFGEHRQEEQQELFGEDNQEEQQELFGEDNQEEQQEPFGEDNQKEQQQPFGEDSQEAQREWREEDGPEETRVRRDFEVSEESWHQSEPWGESEPWYQAPFGGEDGKKASDRLTERVRKEKKAASYLHDNLGTISLVLGVILIFLAGLIFATTTWQVLSDVLKTFLVMACAGLFFGASRLAEKVFHIGKTSNAFYILGSAFLFLSVLAAAYFQLLGPGFILDERNRWKVLWVGSLVMEISFFAGLKRFQDKIYTQVSLWGMTVSLFFMAGALSIGWDGFISLMMIYAAALILVKEYLERNRREERDRQEQTVGELLEEGFRSFAPIHFWIFGIITIARCFCTVAWMVTEACAGCESQVFDGHFLLRFSVWGMGALAALTGGIYMLIKKKKTEFGVWIFRAAVAEMIFYGAGWVTKEYVYRMLVINLVLLILYGLKRWKDSLFWNICGCVSLFVTMLHFYGCGEAKTEELICCLAAFFGYYFWFYQGKRQWPHLLAAVIVLPLPFAALSRQILTFDQIGAGTGSVLVISAIVCRCFYPVIKEDQDHQGGWRTDWFQVLSILDIFLMAAMGSDRWRFGYLLLAALHVLQYAAIKPLKKIAFSVSACLAAWCFWDQPFLLWPPIISLEMKLFPAVWLIWTAGRIWEKGRTVRLAQTVGYCICLLLLCLDAICTGEVMDALILEGICLIIFLWAQIKKNVSWVRISGSLILFIALFMTRDFWQSISWWVYLLAAGVGLILFAAVTEKRRR